MTNTTWVFIKKYIYGWLSVNFQGSYSVTFTFRGSMCFNVLRKVCREILGKNVKNPKLDVLFDKKPVKFLTQSYTYPFSVSLHLKQFFKSFRVQAFCLY